MQKNFTQCIRELSELEFVQMIMQGPAFFHKSDIKAKGHA